MAMKEVIVVFHAAVISNYIIFLLHSNNVDSVLNKIRPERASFGGNLKFLTRWNVLLQAMYFMVAFVNDILGSESRTKEYSTAAQKLRDFMFSSLAFPTGVFVTVAFWSIYLVDRELIFPEELDEYFPPITNHMMHTTPLVSQIIELLLVFHVQPKRLYGLR